MNRSVFALILAVLPLAACGRGGDTELMRRVAQAEAAAARAEDAARRAESAANRAGGSSSSEDEPAVVEDDGMPYGQGVDPEPMVNQDG